MIIKVLALNYLLLFFRMWTFSYSNFKWTCYHTTESLAKTNDKWKL